jgi:hypothetical protein
MNVVFRTALAAGLAAIAWAAVGAQETKEVFQSQAAEEFLRKGTIRRINEIDVGVTQPFRVTLEMDGQSHMAVFKSIDVEKPGATVMANGALEVAFQDTWQTEIAAYEVDKIIGLGMVPATVQRTIRGKVGSLQWWVESKMPEAQRVKENIQPPDIEQWNRTMYKMRLFDQLIYNVDRHLNNVLVTADFDLRLIDHSRSFRPFKELRDRATLARFSRALLEGIKRLEYEDLKRRVGRYLRDGQIRTLLDRRDAILALAQELVAQKGEAAVLYD